MDPAQGGPVQGIRNSIPELERLGVHNEVVCLDDPNAPFLGKYNFPVHAIGAGKGPASYNAKLIPWLLENLGAYDAVIVHGLWLYHSYAVRKAIKLYKSQHLATAATDGKSPKLFIMPHGMLDPYFQKAPGRKLKAIRNWIYWKIIESKVISEADGMLFTCEEELRLARLTFRPYKPQREINVGYGIAEPAMLTPAIEQAFLDRCPSARNRPYILFLSRIHEKKGADLLLMAYAALVADRTGTHGGGHEPSLTENKGNIEATSSPTDLPMLVIAGPGLETPYGQRLHQLAATLPVGSVSFLDMLTGNAKWGAFYGCQAFILPSHQENFGIVVAEAMACSKPVLISNQVNIWREIAASGGGLVEDDSVPGTLRLLRSWCQLGEPEQRAMGKRARAAYLQHFAIGPAAQSMATALRCK